MKNRFDLIIFDWDGTLMDSTDWITHCVQKAAEECGCNIPEDQAVKNIIGLSIQNAIDTLFPNASAETQSQLITVYGQAFFSKQISEKDLFSGVVKMLFAFKEKGYQLAVATGKSRSGLDKALHGTGLSDFFHITRCADETASKPSPKMLGEIIEEMKVSKERAVMVGDSVHDLKMAVNASMASIAVTCGANSGEQLERHNPLLLLNETSELIHIL